MTKGTMLRRYEEYDHGQLEERKILAVALLARSPGVNTSLRHLAQPWFSCLALDLSCVKGGSQPSPSQNNLTRPRPLAYGCIWSRPLASSSCLNHPSPSPCILLFLRPNKSGVTSTTRGRQLCFLFFIFFGSSFISKVFYSHVFSSKYNYGQPHTL